jgi:protein-S-isoprenylcysteine O-methyltransferase Ste14
MTFKMSIFVALAGAVLAAFRRELLHFHSHGPYMFMAAESLLVLFFLNGGLLLENSQTVRLALSWAIMVLSACFALSGFLALRKYGRAVHHWEDTTRLVREGIVRYIRHPLYTSLMLLAVGVLLGEISPGACTACLLAVLFLVTASRVEEAESRAKFGSDYDLYAAETKRYLPFVL